MSYSNKHSYAEDKKIIRLSVLGLSCEWTDLLKAQMLRFGTLPHTNWQYETMLLSEMVRRGQMVKLDCFEKKSDVRNKKTLLSIEKNGFNSKEMPELLYNQILSASPLPFPKDAISYKFGNFEFVKSEIPTFYFADLCGTISPFLFSQLGRLKKDDMVVFTLNSYPRAGYDKCAVDIKGVEDARERLKIQIEAIRKKLVKLGNKPHLVRGFYYNNGSSLKSKMATVAFSLGENPVKSFEGFDHITTADRSSEKKTDSKEYRTQMVFDAFGIWPNNDNGGLKGAKLGGLRKMITDIKKDGIDIKEMGINKALEWAADAPND